MQLVLIRHGESLWNKENRFTGWTDVDLSTIGKKEATLAGEILKDNNFDFDICYTSYLKRAIHTLTRILDSMDLDFLPVIKTWKLNERHYGALQGENKALMADKVGAEQVHIWRRSFDVKPPLLKKGDIRCPYLDKNYREVDKSILPFGESLKDTIDRVIPYYKQYILPKMLDGERVLIVAHGNSLRSLVKYLENISDDDIQQINIPTGIPLVYELDDNGKFIKKYYLGVTEIIT